jgi:hypothetical protein
MQPASVHFDTLPYVPRRFVFGFFFLLIAFFGLMTATYWLIGFGFLISIICLTTFYKVEVNTTEKWFKEYTWVLGLKIGERVSYKTMDYLFINVGKVTETMGSRIKTKTVTRDEYRGFIKFDEKEKIHILTNGDYQRLVKDLTKIAKDFKVRLIDYSSGHEIQLV